MSRASPRAYTSGYPSKRPWPAGEPMAFRTKNRKAERGEVELLRGLIKLANQLQSSLDARRHRPRHRHGAQRDLRLPRGERVPARGRRRLRRARHRRRVPRVRPAALRAAGPQAHLGPALPGEAPDRLVLLRRPPPPPVDRGAAPLPAGAGPRAAPRGRVEQQRRPLRAALRQGPRADGRARPLRPRRPPAADARAGQVARGVRDARGGGDRERAPVRGARGRHGAAAGAAGPAPRDPRAQRRAPRDARAARGLRAHRDAAQGDRRLRRAGGPPRRRGGRRALQRLRLGRGRTRSRCAPGAAPSTSASAAGSCATTRRSSSTTC